MSDAPLDNNIRRLRKRVRLLFVERYALFGASAGAAATVVLVLLSSRYDDLLSYTLWAAVVVGGALLGAAYGLIRRLDDLTVAISADKRSGMKERISTAVVLSSQENLGEVERAAVSDAGRHMSMLKAREVFRHRFGLPHIVFCSTLVVLLGVLFIPQLGLFQSKTRRADAEVMKQEGAKMVKVAKEIQKQFGGKHENLNKIAGKLDQLGRKMQTGRMDKKQAMLKTRRLTKEIQEQQDKLAKENTATKSMQQARSEMEKASRQIAQQKAEEIAKAQHIPPKEALEKVVSDKRLAELARKTDPLSKSEQQELEKAVEKYADPNSKMGIPSELGEALAKLAENKDFQRAAELMQKLTQKMQSGKTSPQDKQALQKQLEQLAKALKNTDLDKLAKQFRENAEKLAKMSPQELQKTLKQMQETQQMAQALQKAGGT